MKWLVLVQIFVVVFLTVTCAGGAVVEEYMDRRSIHTDCFPEFMTCSVESACATQREANSRGTIVLGNYPGCPEPQHIPDEFDPMDLLP